MLRFYQPWWLLALLVIPAYLYWELKLRGRERIHITFNRFAMLRQINGWNRLWKYFYPVLRSLILLCLIVAMARPQWGEDVRDHQQKGVDIVMAIDVSGSMLAVDFQPENRLGAAKKVAEAFIKKRPNDRLGLVGFSEYAISQCPLTFDQNAMLDQLQKLQVNEKASGTAIGLGLAKAVARLKDSDAKSKIVILVTDGVNNTGEIDPISAAEMAKALGIKVYPIGVGTNNYVDFPVRDPLFGMRYQKVLIELDMKTLDRIASITGTGSAASATDAEQLNEVLSQIDRLEKTTYNIKIRYVWQEQFMFFLSLAFVLLMLELSLKLWWYPILPE
ncbi:MAG: aerotolerance regulator BatA [Candidatus Cloacimonetes bacterium HGW-Cloacimonetes-1]|jgi:Ca-activated chloride channel family protein|nr:MAG: aerotolerance regulator BatA [Candidatus Cloacimonetes bacterium HGW-Cloacimonetes-1]